MVFVIILITIATDSGHLLQVNRAYSKNNFKFSANQSKIQSALLEYNAMCNKEKQGEDEDNKADQ